MAEEQKKKKFRTRPCLRCGEWAENPSPAAGRVPDGSGGWVDVKDLILCDGCHQLSMYDRNVFFDQGDWDHKWK